jgi:hypothetical protein
LARAGLVKRWWVARLVTLREHNPWGLIAVLRKEDSLVLGAGGYPWRVHYTFGKVGFFCDPAAELRDGPWCCSSQKSVEAGQVRGVASVHEGENPAADAGSLPDRGTARAGGTIHRPPHFPNATARAESAGCGSAYDSARLLTLIPTSISQRGGAQGASRRAGRERTQNLRYLSSSLRN